MPKLRLDWKKTVAKLVTIIAGVMIALAAGDWWETLSEVAEARGYEERLHEALAVDLEEFARTAERARAVDSAASEVLALYRGKEVPQRHADRFVMAILIASWMPPPVLGPDLLPRTWTTAVRGLTQRSGGACAPSVRSRIA